MGMPMAGEDWRNDDTAALFDAILTLETQDEVAAYFRDLCTFHELEEMSQRWAVARLLVEEIPYRRISELTGVSTTTITRISQWLNHGTGGYRLALTRIGLIEEKP